MSVMVALLGTRMRDAAPVAFHQHGALARFCSDFYLSTAGVSGILNAARARMSARAAVGQREPY